MKDYSCKFEPSYMQKLTVKRLKEKRCYGNWCGTGAGKTISALLVSRELNLRINVIICPNSNKGGLTYESRRTNGRRHRSTQGKAC